MRKNVFSPKKPALTFLFAFILFISTFAQEMLRLSNFNDSTVRYTAGLPISAVDSIYGLQMMNNAGVRGVIAPERDWYIFTGKSGNNGFKLYTVDINSGALIYEAPASFIDSQGHSSFYNYHYSDTLNKLVGFYTDTAGNSFIADCDLQTGNLNVLTAIKNGSKQISAYSHTKELFYFNGGEYTDSLLYVVNPVNGEVDSIGLQLHDSLDIIFGGYRYQLLYDLQYDDVHQKLYSLARRQNQGPDGVAILELNLNNGSVDLKFETYADIFSFHNPFYQCTFDGLNNKYLFSYSVTGVNEFVIADLTAQTDTFTPVYGPNSFIPAGEIFTYLQYDYLNNQVYALRKQAYNAPPAQTICTVTVDTNSTHNIIVWEKLNRGATDSFYVYREIATNQYALITAIDGDSLSEYHDYNANPNATSWRYTIATRDTVHNVSPQSSFHNTLHLQYTGNGNLSWNQYTIGGTSPITTYDVYWDTLNNGNWQVMLSLPGSQSSATDVSFASHPNARYRLVANWPYTCVSSRSSYGGVLSNIISLGASSINENSIQSNFTLLPNPATDHVVIMGDDLEHAIVVIRNVAGQKLGELNTSGNRTELNTSIYPAGLYLITITDAKGNTGTSKLVLEK